MRAQKRGGFFTASFALNGLAAHERRTIRVTGTRGVLRGVFEEGVIEVARPGAFEVERHETSGSAFGHYGGDEGLLHHLTDALAGGNADSVRAAGREALESHLLGFAAEESRERGAVVDLAAFRARIGAPAP